MVMNISSSLPFLYPNVLISVLYHHDVPLSCCPFSLSLFYSNVFFYVIPLSWCPPFLHLFTLVSSSLSSPYHDVLFPFTSLSWCPLLFLPLIWCLFLFPSLHPDVRLSWCSLLFHLIILMLSFFIPLSCCHFFLLPLSQCLFHPFILISSPLSVNPNVFFSFIPMSQFYFYFSSLYPDVLFSFIPLLWCFFFYPSMLTSSFFNPSVLISFYPDVLFSFLRLSWCPLLFPPFILMSSSPSSLIFWVNVVLVIGHNDDVIVHFTRGGIFWWTVFVI